MALLPLGEVGILRSLAWRGQELSALAASGRMRVVPSEGLLTALDGSSDGRAEAARRVLASLVREARLRAARILMPGADH